MVNGLKGKSDIMVLTSKYGAEFWEITAKMDGKG